VEKVLKPPQKPVAKKSFTSLGVVVYLTKKRAINAPKMALLQMFANKV